LERKEDEAVDVYFKRWIVLYQELSQFYNSHSMKKRRFDLKRALKKELDLALNAVLSMAGKHVGKRSDGTVLFCIGDCVMGKPGEVGYYSAFSKHLIERLRSLGYKVLFLSEYLTSQKFPGTGTQTQGNYKLIIESGYNSIRIKYSPKEGIHIHRDIMAAENMADIAAAVRIGLERPTFLRRNVN